MDLSSAVIQACRAIPTTLRLSFVKDSGPSSSLPIRSSASRHSWLDFTSKRCYKQVYSKPVKRIQSCVAAAVVDDRAAAFVDDRDTAVPGCEEGPSLRVSSNSSVTQEREGNSRVSGEGDRGKGGMTRVCDKLIEVFMVDKPTPADWRKLLAFSRGWSEIRPHFFKRCQERADSENDPGKKQSLLRLCRKLKEVDNDVQRHDELLELVSGAPTEINEVVARRRKDFTNEFFVHLHTVAQSYYENPVEHNALTQLENSCLDAVQAYDAATAGAEAVRDAELKFQDILNSSSLDIASKKIDDLAARNQLDSALVLMITKAWSAGKATNLTEEEARDIMYHLYVKSMQNLEKQVPKETRIIKILLRLQDPKEQLRCLEDSFAPGDNPDDLYTTPEALYAHIKTVLAAYHLSEKGTLVGEARDLMSPRTIQKLEGLKELLEKHFM